MRLHPVIMAFGSLAVLAFASESRAQNFFGGNNTAFDPEISIVESGANLDVQATVSHDRKYVTMTMRPQLATLIALREFTFQGPGGIVGQNGNNANINNGRDRSGRPLPAMARPAVATPVLLREGMYRVDTAVPTPVAKPEEKPATRPAK
ncbi:hypothetical protein [Humisphaera borealis]|uniref:Uncharacterized protein n=1 Tax=Humisphaera borealis TaxID=2807512 RepID=A0A7M2WTF1_9BACT|nr:hypothetical protein [Humisphaera borealis]QOV88713.1 hypothetical protein IPV69_21150 [Humisphaera borealis]